MKNIMCFVLALFLAIPVSACPEVYIYDEEDDCGGMVGDCDYGYNDWDSDYSVCGSYQGNCQTNVMAHWANLRDDTGNIIGTVGAGNAVEILGQCSGNPSRTVIYDPTTGCYGTVASVYLYGGTCYEYEHPCLGTGNYDYLSYSSYDNGCGYGYENDYGSGYCDDGSYYEEESYPVGGMVYDETTPWAADNLEAYRIDCEQDAYVGCYEEDEDEGYFSFYQDGDIWIDVNISTQVVNVYNGSKVILSGYCVSGMSGVSDTPCGQFTIQGKQENVTLVGDDYECPVDYWMPFYGGCGFHDADWRGDFGGDIYEYDGSHGCINLEHDFVEEMYEIVPEGCTVNVHGLG